MIDVLIMLLIPLGGGAKPKAVKSPKKSSGAAAPSSTGSGGAGAMFKSKKLFTFEPSSGTPNPGT